jgi:hypothetical protein
VQNHEIPYKVVLVRQVLEAGAPKPFVPYEAVCRQMCATPTGIRSSSSIKANVKAVIGGIFGRALY